MWQTFQGALEKKVKLIGKKRERFDKYAIEKAFKEVLVDQFGQVGLGLIELEIEKQKYIKIKCKNSVWKNEFRVLKNSLVKKVNKKIGGKVVLNIFIS